MTPPQRKEWPVPLHLRNAPTALMEKLGYGKDYKYAHDHARLYRRAGASTEGTGGKEVLLAVGIGL